MAATDPKDPRRRRRLRLVESGARRRHHITIAPPSSQPFPVDALILEEDTWLALSAAPEIHEPVVHPVRTMTEAWEAEPAAPGTILVRPGVPLRILAVVHDLSMAPSWRKEWILAALRRSLTEAQRRGLSFLGIEPLGAVHGRFSPTAFDAMLRELLESEAAFLKAIWRIDR